jgi:Flp pilus assembly protein TadB
MTRRGGSVPDGVPARRPLPLWFLLVGAACSVASLVIALVAGSPGYSVLTGVIMVVFWGWYVVARVRGPREQGRDRR